MFQQTESEEVKCSCNQVGCRVVEMLLPFANDLVVERYMEAFSEELRPLCADRFASHVLEALLGECCKRSLDKDKEDDIKEKFKGYTLKISKFLLNNLEDYVWDVYGNHIIRSVFRNFAQLPSEDVKQAKKKNSQDVKTESIEIPHYYAEILQEYSERLLTWPQFKELPYSELTSALLQILLRALSECDKKTLKKYIKKILDECFCKDSEPDRYTQCLEIFMSKPATMLLETMMEIASPKHYTQIYAKCLKGNIRDLAERQSTNFAVQKLLTFCKEKVDVLIGLN